MSLSDFIAVMRDGKIVQFGPTKEIYRRPRDLYVATFVGKPKMSLVDGELARRGRRRVRLAGPPRGARAPGAIGLREGTFTRVALGVRAEDVRVMPTAARPTRRARSRPRCSCWSRSGPTRSWSSRPATPRSSRASRPMRACSLGQNVTAELTPGRIHLFEREQGERIVE